MLADLRSSKDEGQSNFANPGMMLAGLGADLDLLPKLRVAVNLNSIYFANTAVLEALRNQAIDGNHIGEDASISLTYRPLMRRTSCYGRRMRACLRAAASMSCSRRWIRTTSC